MSEKEVDYGRMLTGLSQGIAALYRHESGLRAFKSKLLVIIDEIDMVLAEDWGKEPRSWYDAISKEHDAAIRAAYEERKQSDAAGDARGKEK